MWTDIKILVNNFRHESLMVKDVNFEDVNKVGPILAGESRTGLEKFSKIWHFSTSMNKNIIGTFRYAIQPKLNRLKNSVLVFGLGHQMSKSNILEKSFTL